MFGFKKKAEPAKKRFQVLAPANGRLIDLGQVNDQVFSTRMMGEGFALVPSDGTITAPVSGTAVSVFPTGHAFGIHTDSGIDVLVHIGLDTVNLQGKGFNVHVKQGQRVNAGEVMVEFNPEILKQNNLDPTTMVIFTEGFPSKIQVDAKNVHRNDPLIG